MVNCLMTIWSASLQNPRLEFSKAISKKFRKAESEPNFFTDSEKKSRKLDSMIGNALEEITRWITLKHVIRRSGILIHANCLFRIMAAS